MINPSVLEKLDQYQEVYLQLKDKLKWSVSDQRTLMMVSSIYVVNQTSFDLERFIDMSEHIKKNVSVLSTLRSAQRFPIAAMLDVRFDQAEEKFTEFIKLYETLIASGFNRGAFSYIAAMVLLTSKSKKDLSIQIEEAQKIYKTMKSQHLFLTNSSDYPLAVLLAQTEGDHSVFMEKIESYYLQLSKNGFRKGNDLQFLSHILALNDNTNVDIAIERCVALLDHFKRIGRKVKPMHYPELGLLSFLNEGRGVIEEIEQVHSELNQEKVFKWYKDLNFIMAVNFIMVDQIQSSVLETGIYTTIETLIQAQQTAMLAALSSTTIIAASSGGE